MIRVLWISNVTFPEAMMLLNHQYVIKSTGGWMSSAATFLVESSEVELTVVSAYSEIKDVTWLHGKRIQYVLIPSQSEHSKYDRYWQDIILRVNPGIVHIHGTESSLGISYMRKNNIANTVISIQGLSSAIAEYHHSGMSDWDIIRNLTIHDVLRGTIWTACRKMFTAGIREREIISKVQYVIGRTTFDKAHVWAINPNVKYFHCNETLRDAFYEGVWSYDKCDRHTIFMSQAQVPIKGVHFLLQALSILKKQYPQVTLYIGGDNILRGKGLAEWSKRRGYGKYIKRLIINLHLQDNVVFLGPLDAIRMKEQMLRCNVFVCPSTIENSPNSLCEAQILGVPCVASFVGGIPDFIPSNNYGATYRFDDCSMLAYYISQIFENPQIYNLTEVRGMAIERHNPQKNSQRTIDIYRQIVNKKIRND